MGACLGHKANKGQESVPRFNLRLLETQLQVREPWTGWTQHACVTVKRPRVAAPTLADSTTCLGHTESSSVSAKLSWVVWGLVSSLLGSLSKDGGSKGRGCPAHSGDLCHCRCFVC